MESVELDLVSVPQVNNQRFSYTDIITPECIMATLIARDQEDSRPLIKFQNSLQIETTWATSPLLPSFLPQASHHMSHHMCYLPLS